MICKTVAVKSKILGVLFIVLSFTWYGMLLSLVRFESMMNQRDNKSQHFILTGATRMPLK